MKGELSDLSKGNEIIFSISAETEEDVNDGAVKVKDAVVFGPPKSFQGMYGYAFADPDRHKLNILKWK